MTMAATTPTLVINPSLFLSIIPRLLPITTSKQYDQDRRQYTLQHITRIFFGNVKH